MEPVTLTTARLVLRPVGPEDTDAVLVAVQDPDIQRWTTVPSPYLPQHARAFVEEIVPAGWAAGTMLAFGVFLAEGSRDLAGMVSVTLHAPGVAEVGFWGTREHRGRGYVTEATLAVARWAFTALCVDRLEWRAEVGNLPSRAVADRAGFTYEGVLRSALLHHGIRKDAWAASLLPSDLELPTTAPYLPAKR